MKLTGWSIDGFGRFHADQVADLPDGLIVVHGPNEAGKTTLMDFLKGMLFGFPDRRHNRRRHEPLNGGTLGGRLFVRTAAGDDLTIERGQSRSTLRVYGDDGEFGAGVLADLLGNAGIDLFDNVFAVDLDALGGLGALDQDAIRDRIFSAGVLGAGQSAGDALRAIESRRDQLWKPTGRGDGYRLKALRSELADTKGALAEAQGRAAAVAEVRTRIDDLQHRADAARAEADAARTHQGLLAAVRDLWAVWSDGEAARLALETTPPGPDLTPDYGMRLAEAQRRADDAEEVATRAVEELNHAEHLASQVTSDPDALAQAAELEALAQQRGVEAERQERAVQLDQRLDTRRSELADELARLGPDCDEAWLAVQPRSVEAEAEIRQAAEPLERARAGLQRANDDAIRRDTERRIDAAALAEARSHAAATPSPDPARARDRVHQVEVLRVSVDRLAQIERDEARDRATRPVAAPSDLPSWLMLTLVALAVVSAAAGVISLGAGNPVPGMLGLVIGIALAVVAVIARGQQAEPGAEAPPTPVAGDTAALTSEIASLASRLGTSPRPTTAELTNLHFDATDAHHRADAAQRALHDAIAAERRFAAASVRRREADANAIAQAQRAFDRASDAWSAWLAGQGLPSTLDAAGVSAFLAGVERARQCQSGLAHDESELSRLRSSSQELAERARATATVLGEDGDQDVLLLLDVLARRYAAAVEADQRRTVHQAGVESAQRSLITATANRDAAIKGLGDVLAEAGAATVAEAEETLRHVERRRALLAQVDQAQRDLTTRCGAEGPQRDGALALLAEGDPVAWSSQATATEQRLREAQDAYDTLRDELTRSRDEVDAALASADVPTLQLRVEGLQAELHEAAAEWAALSVAHRMIEVTLERYKQERQPEVVKRAAGLFTKITDGVYERLVIDGSTIVVVDAAGRHIDATALSRGTVEQLYLCLRFALAEELAATSPLPLMLDDVLVNADPARAHQMTRAVVDVAQRQQVFLFTCHPWVVELVSDAGAPHLLELPAPA